MGSEPFCFWINSKILLFKTRQFKAVFLETKHFGWSSSASALKRVAISSKFNSFRVKSDFIACHALEVKSPSLDFEFQTKPPQVKLSPSVSSICRKHIEPCRSKRYLMSQLRPHGMSCTQFLRFCRSDNTDLLWNIFHFLDNADVATV